MADHVVPHFHNEPGVPVIEIGATGQGSGFIVSADGMLANAENVMPDELKFEGDKKVEFDRDRLTSAVKRVALLSNERSRAVKFQIDKGKVEIASSSPEFGEAKEVPTVDYTGTPVTICFNAQYVLDFLNDEVRVDDAPA